MTRKPMKRLGVQLGTADGPAAPGPMSEPLAQAMEALAALPAGGEFILLHSDGSQLQRVMAPMATDRVVFWLELTKTAVLKALLP